MRLVTSFVVLGGLLAALTAPAGAKPAIVAAVLSKADAAPARAAFKAARHSHWRTARRRAAAATGSPLPREVIDWLFFTRADGAAAFPEIVAFIERHPDWPAQTRLQAQAERAMPPRLSAGEVIAWFEAHRARTGIGAQRFGEALIAAGETARGRAVLKLAWIDHDFTRRDERAFYARHKQRLDPADHAARLDRLLWDGNRQAARRLLHRVAPAQKRLGIARLYLIEHHRGVDAAVAHVPDALRADPGLIYERVRWRRRVGLDERARALLRDLPAELVRPDKWWREIKYQVRRALDDGFVTEAYRLAANNGRLDRRGRAEAAWLAGWIAYRFLRDAETGYLHFTAMYAIVATPISRARAAYWAARAAETLGHGGLAERWYRAAASYPTAFYGQLAAAALGWARLDLPADPPSADAGGRAAFEARSVVRATRMLGELGEDKLMRRFATHLVETAASPAEHALIADLVADYDLPHIGIAAAKRSLRAGVSLLAANYPMPFAASDVDGVDNAPEPALLLALSRQESEMNPAAVSPSGARGLLQLLPATAKQMAHRLRVRYSRAKLIREPIYNLRLGAAYLGQLLDQYDHAYVLALAAYNAGPARVKRWLRTYGDPRLGEVDPIDWIEMLPFPETRNYIQRVLESTEIYRHRLAAAGDGHRLLIREHMVGTPARLARR